MSRFGANRPVGAGIATLLAAVVAGCSGSSPPPEPGGAPATSAPDDADFMEIESPRDGAVVRAISGLPGSRRAKVHVTGVAAPDATILLSGGCEFQGCNSVARAGMDGHWKGDVWVLARSHKPSAVVEASSSTSAEPLARVRVRLRGAPQPEATATPEPKRSGSRRRARTPQPAQPTVPAAPQPLPAATTGVRRLVLVGDSLAEGIKPLMPSLLPGWQVQADALTSRPLAAGMSIVAALDLSAPTALAISLFTNDDPRNVSALDAAVRTTVQRSGTRGCAIWATIVRPPVNGVSYQAANARLTALQSAFAGRLLIVPWADQVARHPEWLAGDGVHATPDGYRARAQMYAQAALACGR